MGALPTIKRFSNEDFPEQSSWIGKLFFPLNQLLQTLYANLNNGLTLSENIKAQVVTLPVTGASPTTSFPYKFSPLSPIGVSVMSVVQTNSPAVTLTAAVGCLWTIANGVITVSIQGLNSGSSYNITLVAWGG